MSFRDPVYPLENHCSVVHKNTLYVYSPQGFQSLDLARGSEWEKLPMDISLTGAECVLAPASGDAATDMMFVVGGRVNETASTWDYPGLMHYSFKDKKWDWQRSESWVTKERTNHAAIYMPGTKQILVYSGSSDPQSNGLSSDSFLIDTKAPYVVLSQPTGDNPPLTKPMLMPWDKNHAVMVGGSASNTAIYTFGAMTDASGQLEGWKNLELPIPSAIVSPETVQCTLIDGDDGSKVLETFDMGVTPNVVTRTVLLGKNGLLSKLGSLIGDKTKRLTIDDFPTYNDTFAPKTVRSGYSIAKGDDGTTVFTGGNAEDPVAVFDAQKNSWVNATEFFTGSQLQSVLQPSSSSSTSSSPTTIATETPAASSSTAALPPAAPVNNKDRMLTVLGATLGAIFGIAALLILLLFFLRWRKSKKRRTQQGGYVEKNRLSFADRGAEFMKEAGGSVGQPRFTEVNGSQTSLAIIAGRANGNGHKRGMLSDASTSGLVKKASPLGYTEPVELSKFDLKPEPIDEKIVRQNSGRIPPQPKAANLSRSRSSGWSRYFANNDATNLAAMPADRSTFASERTSTGSQSMYDNGRTYSQPLQAVPPLDIPKFENQRISKVATGSPTFGNSTENLPGQPMQAELARANSGASTRSGISRDDHYLREPIESWTPVGLNERPASSAYTGSVVIDNYRDGASSYYPDAASSFYPKSGISSFYPGQPRLGAPDVRDSTNTVFPAGNLANMQASQRQDNNFDSFYPAPPRLAGAPDGRESTVTVFPGGPASEARKNGGQDMSWLNLGVGK